MPTLRELQRLVKRPARVQMLVWGDEELISDTRSQATPGTIIEQKLRAALGEDRRIPASARSATYGT